MLIHTDWMYFILGSSNTMQQHDAFPSASVF